MKRKHVSTIERITITLTAEMVQDVPSAVQAGEYVSSSEIIHEACATDDTNGPCRNRSF
jgi:metal-responsive CopG/Arc/MetJ family transcriptional regulator